MLDEPCKQDCLDSNAVRNLKALKPQDRVDMIDYKTQTPTYLVDLFIKALAEKQFFVEMLKRLEPRLVKYS